MYWPALDGWDDCITIINTLPSGFVWSWWLKSQHLLHFSKDYKSYWRKINTPPSLDLEGVTMYKLIPQSSKIENFPSFRFLKASMVIVKRCFQIAYCSRKQRIAKDMSASSYRDSTYLSVPPWSKSFGVARSCMQMELIY